MSQVLTFQDWYRHGPMADRPQLHRSVVPEAYRTEVNDILLAALCRTYSAQVDAGVEFLPVPARSGVTATDIMVTASGLLRSANLAVFELGMWQSCTGR